MERIQSMLREGKVYGMVALIMAIVWSAGYSARVDERWKQTEWLAAVEHDPAMMIAELDLRYFDDGTSPVAE